VNYGVNDSPAQRYGANETAHVSTADMQPDLDSVLQVEDEPHVVPTKVCEPVDTRELPAKRMSPRTVSVTTTAGAKLLSADPRRKSATIVARSQDIRIGVTQSQALLNGAWFPGVVPFVSTAVTELWAVGDGADTDVSVIEEYFA
jgi:hypothetical protein